MTGYISKLSPAVGRSELMPDGTDRAFRVLVHNLLCFSERLLALRNRFATLLGMSRAQYTLLTGIVYLQTAGGASLQDVSAHLRFDPARARVEADKLVAAGVLEWVEEGGIHVQLSSRGIALLNDLVRIQAPVDDALFRTLSAEEFEKLSAIVAQLVGNADAAHKECGAIDRMVLRPTVPVDVETAKVDTQELRSALGHFATGVTIVTAEVASGRPIGVTMNSFNSVSLDPPLVLFSVANTALSLRDLESATHYAINVLRADQHEFSRQFAKPLGDKWSGVPVKRGRSGCLMLEHSLAAFECVPYATYDGGDHVIFVGRVVHLHLGQHAAPLLYYRGTYASVAGLPSSARGDDGADQEGMK